MSGMASRVSEAVDLRERLGPVLEKRREPGVAELCDRLQEMLGATIRSPDDVHLERLTKGVYRLRTGLGDGHSLVLKRHEPAVAQTDRLLVERWLPALGLGDRCPQLVAAVAQRDGRWVWHLYEDLRSGALADPSDPQYPEAAVDLIAELHTRGAGHPLLPEVRWRGHDHGMHSLASSLRDSIAVLEALARRGDASVEFATSIRRLLERLYRLLEEAPRQVRLVETSGGPDTLLHGDLCLKNVFVQARGERPRAWLIDWDHVGVGSFSYDVSTFLYQTSAEARPWMLQRYREAVTRAGWCLPADAELNALFHIAEIGRGVTCIIWPAVALLHDGAEWGRAGLLEIERWFAALCPPLPQ